MMGTMSMRQPENWLYEVWQKGYDSPCYVMVPNAKDLVKSHLMIAVREEVEVLKEKISELMDKINQLEVENTILKSNMTQETLQQLQMQTQLQIAGSAATPAITAPPSTNNTSVVVAATAANVTTNGNSATNTTTANATSNGVPNATAASAVPAVTTPTSGVAINALQQQLQQQTTPVESAIGNTNVEAEGVAVNQSSAVTTNGPLS